jgi:hypothetical protein
MREVLAFILLVSFGWFIHDPQRYGEYMRSKYNQFFVGWNNTLEEPKA